VEAAAQLRHPSAARPLTRPPRAPAPRPPTAVPEEHKASLLPQLKAKPVRTASGIAVVAVMSKPHRCPHIATTGARDGARELLPLLPWRGGRAGG
jgi:hypothetical protein